MGFLSSFLLVSEASSNKAGERRNQVNGSTECTKKKRGGMIQLFIRGSENARTTTISITTSFWLGMIEICHLVRMDFCSRCSLWCLLFFNLRSIWCIVCVCIGRCKFNLLNSDLVRILLAQSVLSIEVECISLVEVVHFVQSAALVFPIKSRCYNTIGVIPCPLTQFTSYSIQSLGLSRSKNKSTQLWRQIHFGNVSKWTFSR